MGKRLIALLPRLGPRLFLHGCIALICASSLALAYESPASRRAKYNFNPGWKLFVGDPAGAAETRFDDSAWKEVTLPRAWNEDDAFRLDIRDLSTGVSDGKIEIPGTPDPQSCAGKGGGKSTIGIIELEIYEPLEGVKSR